MPPSPDPSKADSRQRLLDAARELLWLSSYGAVSVDDLCRRAEVNKGSFYHHFDSKSALAVAAFEAHWEEMRPALDGIFSPQVPPLERLDRYAAVNGELQAQKRQEHGHVLGCPYTSLGCEAGAHEAGLRQVAALKAERACRYFASAIRDAQAAGQIPPGDPERLALECQAYVAGTAAQARIQDSLEPFQRLADGLRRLLGAPAPSTP
ncbi:MAG: TetR/AcrR family transcriptional regulator [Planctomycetes bacterium]|nr:TetR/AcrR family transcriptional regulator [Planctomycetota bacterium]